MVKLADADRVGPVVERAASGAGEGHAHRLARFALDQHPHGDVAAGAYGGRVEDGLQFERAAGLAGQGGARVHAGFEGAGLAGARAGNELVGAAKRCPGLRPPRAGPDVDEEQGTPGGAGHLELPPVGQAGGGEAPLALGGAHEDSRAVEVTPRVTQVGREDEPQSARIGAVQRDGGVPDGGRGDRSRHHERCEDRQDLPFGHPDLL